MIDKCDTRQRNIEGERERLVPSLVWLLLYIILSSFHNRFHFGVDVCEWSYKRGNSKKEIIKKKTKKQWKSKEKREN